MVVTSEQIGAAEAAFEKLPLSKKLEAVGALARAERSAAANPYGFPLSSTGSYSIGFQFDGDPYLKNYRIN